MAEISRRKRFVALIFCWHRSVWKYIWKEIVVWLILYYIIRFVLFYAVPEDQELHVKNVVKKFEDYVKTLPIEFLLGFYVSQTVTRWWNQTTLVSSPHDLMGIIVSYIYETDVESRRIRFTIARYLVLYYAIGYKKVSSKLAAMFDSFEKYIQSGLMTKEEAEILSKVPAGVMHEYVYQWVLDLVREKIGNKKLILTLLNDHRSKMKQLSKYNDVQMPLVYTQTVTIVVYGYFIFALIGHQFYNDTNTDVYFPFFTVLRFIFSLGWLKVAEYLSKPFGDDDDDIDLCQFLSKYCTNVFALADYPNTAKPIESWADEECNPESMKQCFDVGIRKVEPLHETLSKKIKSSAVVCHRRSDLC